MPPPDTTGRCLYEVLGVDRTCSIEEIRSAYKRLALRLHPDKVAQSTPNRPTDTQADHAAATAAFQELQHAYDVLRDPKERSWYDSHRAQILFSTRADKTDTASPADLSDLFSFFSPSAYSGYSNTQNGFYNVYGNLFLRIHSNEVKFSEERLDFAPLFGDLDSSFEQWNSFYKYWLGFSTVIEFSWADLYDVREGPNRRVRREMEELNLKARRKMKREYSDTVRSLAAFVKKRDKRVVEMMKKKKAEEEAKKEEQKRKKEEDKRRRKEKVREFAAVDDGDDDDGVVDEDWFGLEDGGKKKKRDLGGEEEFYCVVCGKKFKSEKQWKNHEQSKKHREKVAELRESLIHDDEDGFEVGFDYVKEGSDGSDEKSEVVEEKLEEGFKLGEEDNDDGDDVGNGFAVGFDYVKSEVVEEICERIEKGFGLGENEDDGDGDDDETVMLETMISKHRSKKAASNDEQVNGFSPAEPVETLGIDGDGESPSMEYNPRRKSRKSKASKKGNASKLGGNTKKNLDDDDEEERGQVLDEPALQNWMSKKGGHLKNQQPPRRQHVDQDEDAVTGKISNKGKKHKGSSKAGNNMCGTCGEGFDSRNKLFAHLGDTGHAMLKTR